MLKKKQKQKTKPKKKKTTATVKNIRILEFLLIKKKEAMNHDFEMVNSIHNIRLYDSYC
jgi:hypothetical protein